jgi:Autophagy protein ATG9
LNDPALILSCFVVCLVSHIQWAVYFSSLYTYYYHRGFVPILTKGIVDLVGLFFTLVLSVFLFAFVKWDDLFQCIDEASCHPHFGAYLHAQPFRIYPWSSWTALVVTYATLFAAYGTFAIWTFVHVLRQASVAEWVFENRLGISRRKLEGGAVDWDSDVVAKLVQLQESGEYRVAIHQNSDQLNALVIANRIMRKENFLIAMFNCGVLDLTVPWLKGQTFFCSSVEVSLCVTIKESMYLSTLKISSYEGLSPSPHSLKMLSCRLCFLSVGAPFCRSQLFVQSQVPDPAGILSGPGRPSAPIHPVRRRARDLPPLRAVLPHAALWLPERVRLEVHQKVLGTAGMEPARPVAFSGVQRAPAQL